MKFTRLKMKELVLITEAVNHSSINGYRQNTYSYTQMRQHGIEMLLYESEIFVEEKNTLKGMYYQRPENQENILFRCIHGKVQLKIIDIRATSNTYRHAETVMLSDRECKYVYIPYGFAHGFLTLEDDTIVQYKSDNRYYWKATEIINPLDSMLNLQWAGENFIMSMKERYAKGVSEVEKEFVIEQYEEKAQGEDFNEFKS